jgi:AAA family ATP:ADP antiporter
MSGELANAPALSKPQEAGPGHWFARLCQVHPGEWVIVGWSWLYIFSILSSYYVMRPIRDQMGISGGIENLPWLFTGTLVGMVVLNIPFGYLVKRLPRVRFIPVTYRFFGANILLFALALHVASPEQAIWIGRSFFIWLSVFNLFVVSIFWQAVVDVFSHEQGKRLFGLIAAGATLGAIAGSATTAMLARSVPTSLLLLGAAVLLEVAVFSVKQLSRMSDRLNRVPLEQSGEHPVGGRALAGITHALKSRYLLNVSLFLLLFSITATFLYFEQVGITARAFPDRAAQTTFFATVDLLVNVLTLAIQLFLTGRIVRIFGVGLALASLPLLSVFGFAALVYAPTVIAIVAFQVLRRAGNFGVARPTREVLFTVLPREDRYKAKSFIDTVVYRLGDQVGAWAYALVGALGWGSRALPLVAIPISLVWLVNAIWLGRRQEQLAAEQAADNRVCAEGVEWARTS